MGFIINAHSIFYQDAFKCLSTAETHSSNPVYSVRPLSTTGFSSAVQQHVQL